MNTLIFKSYCYGFLQKEEQYTTKTALKGFDDEEKELIFDLLKRIRLNIEEDWKLVKSGEQRRYLKDKRHNKSK